IYWVYDAGHVANAANIAPGTAVLDYITGYLVELSLSIDNVFVIAVIFSSFKIPAKYQHRVLFWGILGAMVFLALLSVFGVALIIKFDWIIYVFGAFLVCTAFNMLKKDVEKDPKDSWLYKKVSNVIPITDEIKRHDF